MNTFKFIILILGLAFILSCEKQDNNFLNRNANNNTLIKRQVSEEERNVMLLYIAGQNNLAQDQASNIKALIQGYIPEDKRTDNVILVFSKIAKNGNYRVNQESALYRIYKNIDDEVKMDTLLRLPSEYVVANAKTLNFILNYIKREFPAKGYGMIFSSHSTGWLPIGYYDHNIEIKPKNKDLDFSKYNDKANTNTPKINRLSFGNEVVYENDRIDYEIELNDFAAAIPYKLDYLIMDVCFGTGIETLYALKDKTKYLVGCPSEIIARGMEYISMSEYLVKDKIPHPEKVAKSSFEYYDNQTGEMRSATMAYIDCSKIDTLQELCSELFQKYKTNIYTLTPMDVQRYYRGNKAYFFDLKDILLKAGINSEELQRLNKALNDCVIYKANTPSFLKSYAGFDISTYSGISGIIPYVLNEQLRDYYKTFEWNKVTRLVD